MIIVSYGTKNTPYEKVIKEYLIPTLKKWNLSYDIRYPKDKGSWQANTHMKAEFIKRMLLKHKQAVVFLDSDATIEKFPQLFFDLEKKHYDIGVHFLNWFKMWRKKEGNPKREALSGTLFVNYTPEVLKFLDAWIEENKKSKDWEQRNMEMVLNKYKDKLKIYSLPYSYITIIWRDGKIPEHMIKKEDVVILHWQKSREYKNRGKWKK